jgi:MOSC domain-containing protein YiiM
MTMASAAAAGDSATPAAAGEVVTMHTVREKDGVAQALLEATLVAGFGIDGDARSRTQGGRQLTLIEEEALQATGERLGYPVPPGASRRQVMVRGLPLQATIGKTLRIGEVVLAVDGPCDPCDNMDRKIGPGAREAMAGWGGVCARVVQGGTLKVGDAIRLEA